MDYRFSLNVIGKEDNMTFQNFKNKYPINSTVIGWYSLDSWLEIDSFKTIEFIDNWRDNPFAQDKDYYGFMCYNTETNEFECWYFYFNKICGYAEITDGYRLITNMEDFGYELWNLDNLNETIENAVLMVEPNIEKVVEYFIEENRIVFKNSEMLKNFVTNGKKLM